MGFVEVWAPYARSVSLLVDNLALPMNPSRAGWWSLEAKEAQHGALYSFALDGGTPLPDPRSPSQPHGVHGPSCFVDHSRFRWTDRAWQPPPLRSGVIYELHIGTFTPKGTFESAIDCLDHLVSLGITHVELMPVAEFPGNHGWGYDGVDLWAPHHPYGGPESLKRFVDACHAKGLAVLLDVVYNHLGPDGNYLGQFGPYFTARYQTPWGEAVNLDGEGCTEVRRFFCDNAKMWLRDCHFDGLRLDAVHAYFDHGAVHFLEQLAREVDLLEGELGRPLVLIAESDLNDPRVVATWEVGGYGIAAQWADDFHHSLHSALTGEIGGYYSDFGQLSDLKTALETPFVYGGRYSVFRKRHHGRPPVGIPNHRFVVSLQNHDQIGNRAQGDRLSALISTDALRLGAAVLLTAPYIPMLFQGEEWGASTPFQFFTDHQDPSVATAVTKGRMNEFSQFGWLPENVPDPQLPATFHASKLDWSEPHREPHREILAWHRDLIQLRRSLPIGVPQVEQTGNTLRITRGNWTLEANFDRQSETVMVS